MSTEIYYKSIPITKPYVPEFETIAPDISEILEKGKTTNAKYVEDLENAVAEYLGVEHAVAVSSSTAGMMLTIKSMGLNGEVILPGFNFHSSADAVLWNGLKLKFVDIDPETWTIDPDKIEENITENTSAICGAHIFGNPCDIEKLLQIAEDNNLKLYFDASHALGSKYHNEYIGNFGNAEIFSLNPSTSNSAGEGGIVTTNDDDLKDYLLAGRNYGDEGELNSRFPAFNARMSEFNAVLANHSLKNIEENIRSRNGVVTKYRNVLGNIPGISFQKITEHSRSACNEFAISINPDEFGMTRDELSDKLFEVNIETRKHYYPPVHRQQAYSEHAQSETDLPVTGDLSEHVLSLPIWSQMSSNLAGKVCTNIQKIRMDSLK
ncbi:DegT/DnrJ/EryC1/StrS aminotransferase family protein [Methanohalobium sp.]|uniref:DegT/DnrJ/EryC1/StrS family aminotransferase n=1 Tax=Methanohalobium sp. TaxID=2837493 RepID=UPI0025FF8C91|nr:DegT/DnrJ/EryC1/StrS family aminotransferase [Methanohalobium sp.]